jgi:O-antigen/teichoic acid export membrane protein
MAIHLNILLGRERIKAYNFIFFIQHLLATILLVVFFVVLKKEDIFYYLVALYISYFTAFISAFIFTFHYVKSFKLPSFTEFKSMIRYGFLGQSANIFQLINYRLGYYLIDAFVGRASLGVFSAATQISEGLWIFGKSIATVLFARISNSRDIEYARNLSLRLLKFTASITIIPLIVLIFMPESFYEMLLGNDFTNVRTIIRLLALGTLSLSASMILSQYFSGIGRIEMNTAGSGLGVVVTVILGLMLIPTFGVEGAAVVNSISYLVSLIFLIYHFNKETPVKFQNWLLSKEDIIQSWGLSTSKIKKKNS